MSSNSDADYYLKKLEEFETKYGKKWVEKTYSKAPEKDSPYYEFAMKMHAVYTYKLKGTEEDKKVLEQALLAKNPKDRPRPYKGFNISPQLQASLSGFNGGRGGKTNSPEQFFERWFGWKSGKAKNPKVKKVLDEAIERKADVMLIIAHFFNTKHKKVTNPKALK